VHVRVLDYPEPERYKADSKLAKAGLHGQQFLRLIDLFWLQNREGDRCQGKQKGLPGFECWEGLCLSYIIALSPTSLHTHTTTQGLVGSVVCSGSMDKLVHDAFETNKVKIGNFRLHSYRRVPDY
jgi:hypothetical protein